MKLHGHILSLLLFLNKCPPCTPSLQPIEESNVPACGRARLKFVAVCAITQDDQDSLAAWGGEVMLNWNRTSPPDSNTEARNAHRALVLAFSFYLNLPAAATIAPLATFRRTAFRSNPLTHKTSARCFALVDPTARPAKVAARILCVIEPHRW